MHLASVHHCLILRTDRNHSTARTHWANMCCKLMGCLLPLDSSCSGNVEQFILQYYPSPTTSALLAANNPVPSCLVAGLQPVLSLQITGQGSTDCEFTVGVMQSSVCKEAGVCWQGVHTAQQHVDWLVRKLTAAHMTLLQRGKWTARSWSCGWSTWKA